MKGVIFTEFLDMVGSTFGEDMVDDIIDTVKPPSGGAYTATGTYDHTEIVNLVVELGRRTETPVPDLLQAYGEYLFGRFVVLYPRFFEGENSAFGFLQQVESYIHVEVKKLYPDAMLPEFDTSQPSEDTLSMVYKSERHLQDVAEGLIKGCLKHFAEPCTVSRDDEHPDGVLFTLTKTAA